MGELIQWLKDLCLYLFKKKDPAPAYLKEEMERVWNDPSARIWIEKPYSLEEIQKGIMSINDAAKKGCFYIPQALK